MESLPTMQTVNYNISFRFINYASTSSVFQITLSNIHSTEWLYQLFKQNKCPVSLWGHQRKKRHLHFQPLVNVEARRRTGTLDPGPWTLDVDPGLLETRKTNQEATPASVAPQPREHVLVLECEGRTWRRCWPDLQHHLMCLRLRTTLMFNSRAVWNVAAASRCSERFWIMCWSWATNTTVTVWMFCQNSTQKIC